MKNVYLPLMPQAAGAAAIIMLCSLPGASSGLGGLAFLGYAAALTAFVVSRTILFLGNKPNTRADLHLLIYTALLLFVILIGFLRGVYVSNGLAAFRSSTAGGFTLLQVTVALVTCYLLGMYLSKNRHRVIGNVFYWAAVSMALGQIVLFLLGVDHKLAVNSLQTTTLSTTFAAAGLDVTRWQAPLSTGVNGGALFFTFSLLAAILMRNRHSNFMLALVCLASLFGLALIDSRTPLYAVPVALFLSKAFRNSPRAIASLAVLAPCIPLLIVVFVDIMPKAIIEVAQARYDTYGMFSGREAIWTAVWYNYIENINLSQLVFGEGFYGQVGSGLVLSYAYLFDGFGGDVRELATLHNTYVQVIVDYGLIGISLYIAVVWRMTYLLAVRSNEEVSGDAPWRLLLCLMFVMLFSAGTETVLTPYVKEGFSFFLMVLFPVCIFARTSPPPMLMPSNLLGQGLTRS